MTDERKKMIKWLTEVIEETKIDNEDSFILILPRAEAILKLLKEKES